MMNTKLWNLDNDVLNIIGDYVKKDILEEKIKIEEKLMNEEQKINEKKQDSVNFHIVLLIG